MPSRTPVARLAESKFLKHREKVLSKEVKGMCGGCGCGDEKKPEEKKDEEKK